MVSISTPSYSHLKCDDFEKIYEPVEDSFLMMDALENDANLILDKRPLICVEVGPGSGILITFLASVIKNNAFYIASDINNYASSCTVKTGIENRIDINATTDNLVSSFNRRLNGKVDVLLFNPPYVVTPSEEIGDTSLAASWAGGVDGREVIDKFLPIAASLVSPTGLFYLLLTEQNKPDEIIAFMSTFGFHSSVILRRRSGSEHLLVVRFSRDKVV